MASPKQQRIDPNAVAKAGRVEPAKRIETAKDAGFKPQPKSVQKKKNRSGRPGLPPKAVVVRKATLGDWIGGARIRTLPLSIAPVILGTASAHVLDEHGWHWVRALLALAVAVALQIGVNYSNDYSDGVRGTDKYRVGPSRLTGSGAAKPSTVLAVAVTFFGLGAIAGVILVVLTGQYWLLAVGAVCIVAAYFYTGGKRPYGYYGLGEVFVFVFFGIVATFGTMYVQEGTINIEATLSGISIGLIACAVLMVNNIRDIAQDRVAKKRTLAVLIGDRASRIVFAVFLLVPYGILAVFCLFYVNAYFTYFTLLAALPAAVITLTGKTPQEFITALKLTSLTALAFALILGWAIAF